MDKWVLLALSRTRWGTAPHGDDDDGNDPCLRFRRSAGRLALDQLCLLLARAAPMELTTEGGWVYPADRQGYLETDKQRHRAVYEQPLNPSMPTSKRLRSHSQNHHLSTRRRCGLNLQQPQRRTQRRMTNDDASNRRHTTEIERTHAPDNVIKHHRSAMRRGSRRRLTSGASRSASGHAFDNDGRLLFVH